MAVLDDVPGVEVTMQVAGQTSVEYDVDQDEEQSMAESTTCPTVTKFVESVDDVEFAIKVAAGPDYVWGYRRHTLVFCVYVDGHRVGGRFLSAQVNSDMIRGNVAYCPETQQWTSYKLMFSAVSTTDDTGKERVAHDRKLANRLGHIRVTVERHIKLEKMNPKPLANHTNKLELAEKSMKGSAISHGTKYLSTGKTKAPKCFNSKRIPGDDGPIAVFNFLYRSRDALQKMLIVPRDEPPSSAQLFAKLSKAEIERLAKERFEQMQQDEEHKQEAKPSLCRKAIKIEDLTGEDANPTPAKRRALCIDLTDD